MEEAKYKETKEHLKALCPPLTPSETVRAIELLDDRQNLRRLYGHLDQAELFEHAVQRMLAGLHGGAEVQTALLTSLHTL